MIILSIFFLGAADSDQWEGTVAMAQYGEFPASGYYGASNAFPRNSIVEVENTQNGKTVSVIIISRLDQEGLFLLVSREAAEDLGLYVNEVIRANIRLVMSASALVDKPSSDLAYNPDPDVNPAASVTDSNDSVYLRAIQNLEDRYAVADPESDTEDTQEDQVQDTQITDTQEDQVQDTQITDTQEDQVQDTQIADTQEDQVQDTQIADTQEDQTVDTDTQITDSGDTPPELNESGSRIPPENDLTDTISLDTPVLDSGLPEIAEGFVKAEDYNGNNFAQIPPVEPETVPVQTSMPDQQGQEGSVNTAMVEPPYTVDDPEFSTSYPNPLYAEGDRTDLDDPSLPDDYVNGPDYADLEPGETISAGTDTNTAIAVPSLDDGLLLADAFAEPGQFTYSLDDVEAAEPEDPAAAFKGFLVDDSNVHPHSNRNFSDLSLLDPELKDADYAVYDSLFAETKEREEQFTNLTNIADPEISGTDTAQYEGLFASAEEQPFLFTEGNMPVDPYSLDQADSFAGIPFKDRDGLLATHTPELNETDYPQDTDYMAASPAESDQSFAVVDELPSAPVELTENGYSYDGMQAVPFADEPVEFAESDSPELPGSEVSTEDISYASGDETTFDTVVTELPADPIGDPDYDESEYPGTELASADTSFTDPLIVPSLDKDEPKDTAIASNTTSSDMDSTALTVPEKDNVASVTLIPADSINSSTSSTSTAVITASAAVENADFSTESGLESGNDYLQLAVYSDQSNVMKLYDELSSNFPMTVLVSGTRNDQKYKVLIGPLHPDESGLLLLNFKRKGYKDAFIRQGTN